MAYHNLLQIGKLPGGFGTVMGLGLLNIAYKNADQTTTSETEPNDSSGTCASAHALVQKIQ